MNSEDQLFWKLKRLPFEDMCKIMDQFHCSMEYINSTDKRAASTEVLHIHGWDYDEYCLRLY